MTTGVYIPGHIIDDKRVGTRFRLWLRQQGRCRWCGEIMRTRGHSAASVTVDHIIPRSKGGTDDFDNLTGACRRCNGLRGDSAQFPNGDSCMTTNFATADVASLVPSNAAPLTMSSREIADLTDKRHDNVMRDIRAMLAELHGEGGVLKFEDTFVNEQNGQEYPIFRLPKRETLVLVAGYNVTLRARIIDRWQELEARDAFDPRALMNNPAALGKLFLQFAEREHALQGQIEEMRPQVQALDRIALSDGSFCITDAAKTLQVQPKVLFSFLRSHRWIYSRQGAAGEVAYQDKLANGFLEHKTTTVTRSDGSEKTVTQVRVTAKGLTRLAKELQPAVSAVA